MVYKCTSSFFQSHCLFQTSSYYVKAMDFYTNTAACVSRARLDNQMHTKSNHTTLCQLCMSSLSTYLLLFCWVLWEIRTRIKTTNLRPLTPHDDNILNPSLKSSSSSAWRFCAPNAHPAVTRCSSLNLVMVPSLPSSVPASCFPLYSVFCCVLAWTVRVIRSILGW